MKYLKKFNESKKDNKPNIKKMEIDGYLVMFGKDSVSNDYLTLEMTSPEDYWFHAKGVPGSHVVIKVSEKVPTGEVIKKVAQIAAKNSKSESENILVVYCKKKFVTKEPDMKPGQVKVDYKNSYEILVPKN